VAFGDLGQQSLHLPADADKAHPRRLEFRVDPGQLGKPAVTFIVHRVSRDHVLMLKLY
jgi:hypothetical protein